VDYEEAARKAAIATDAEGIISRFAKDYGSIASAFLKSDLVADIYKMSCQTTPARYLDERDKSLSQAFRRCLRYSDAVSRQLI
jgi:hypothetical protein